MGSLYVMDKETEEVRYEVTEPAVLLDTFSFTMLKIGNREDVIKYYEKSIQKCKQAQSDLFESWVVMDLPKDEKILNKIFHNVGYLETFYNGIMASLEKENNLI